MRILAIDTAMNGCSVGLYDSAQGVMLANRASDMVRGHAEHLVPMVEATLLDATLSYCDIDLIAVTRGPGAFTGMRIGLSCAKSLALTLGVPCVGVSTLESIAEECAEGKIFSSDFCVLLETKRDDYYIQQFSSCGSPLSDAHSIGYARILETFEGVHCFAGDAVERFAKNIGSGGEVKVHELLLPKALFIARNAIRAYNQNAEDTRSVDPLYLRDADVSKPKTKPRILNA